MSSDILEKVRVFLEAASKDAVKVSDDLIDQFGPDRCMFESNFPVDKQSISYHVLWNAFKKMTKDFNEEDKEFLFYKTAKDFYSL